MGNVGGRTGIRVRDQGSGNRDQESGTEGTAAESKTAPAKKKLSYLEAREFAAIEQRVEASDARLAAARKRVDDPAIATDAGALQRRWPSSIKPNRRTMTFMHVGRS